MATPSLEKNTIIEKLLGAGQSAERDLLFSRYFALLEEIDKYLDEHKSRRIVELQQRRDLLWSECRQAEDKYNNLQNEVGVMNSAVNQVGAELSAARAGVSEAQHKPFSSSFPTSAEIEKWGQHKMTAKMRLDQVAERHRSTYQQLDLCRQRQHLASAELHKLTEQLRAVDSQLNDIQGTQVKS